MKLRTMKKAVAFLAALIVMAAAIPALGVENDPERLDTLYSLAVKYINKPDYDKAMEYLDTALNYCDENNELLYYADIHLKKACVYIIREDYDNALTELDETIRVSPELAEPYELKGDIYSTLDDPEKALEFYQTAIDAGKEETPAFLFNVASNKIKIQDYQGAIANLEKITEDETYGPDACYNLGICNMNVENYENALAAFGKCEAFASYYNGYYFNVGVCNMQLGKNDEAIEAFTKSSETETYKEDAMYNRAICRFSAASLAADEEKPAIFLAAAEDLTEYLNLLNEAAKASAEEGAEVPEVINQANYYRAFSYMNAQTSDMETTEYYDKAYEDFNRCIENEISPVESHYFRGLLNLQTGKVEEGIEDLTLAIDGGIDTQDITVFLTRSEAYKALGNYEAAIADVTTLIERGYELSNSYKRRSELYELIGDEDHSIEDLETSLLY